MKIRTSFVANSSSSSFVMAGYFIDKEATDLFTLASILIDKSFDETKAEVVAFMRKQIEKYGDEQEKAMSDDELIAAFNTIEFIYEYFYEFIDRYKTLKYNLKYGSESTIPDDQMLIGEEFGSFDEYPDEIFDIGSFSGQFSNLRDTLKVLGIETDGDLKLVIGTESC